MKVTIEMNQSAVSILTANDKESELMAAIKRAILGAGFSEEEYVKMVIKESNKLK